MNASGKTAEALERAIEVAVSAGRLDVATRLAEILKRLPQPDREGDAEKVGR